MHEHKMLVEEQWEKERQAELEMHTCYSKSLLLACPVAT